jgi:hypothetical protein
MALRYAALCLLLLTGCASAPQAAAPRLYLAGDGELWVVDVAHQRVQHLRRPVLERGDAPHRILARGNRLIMGGEYGDDAFFLPSPHRDRVWVVDVNERAGGARAVREVTTDGVTTVAATVPPEHRRPLAAVDGGLLLEARGGLDVWDPHADTVVRHLEADPLTLGPTSGNLLVSCTEPGCHELQLTDSRTGAARAVQAPRAFTFEPWSAAFAPGGALLAVPVRVVADGPRQLALIDLARGRVAVVPRSSVPPGYTLIAWSASGKELFLSGGGAYGTPRVLVGYRLGTRGAQSLDVAVGAFYDLAAI